jgi:hypothetical protein
MSPARTHRTQPGFRCTKAQSLNPPFRGGCGGSGVSLHGRASRLPMPLPIARLASCDRGNARTGIDRWQRRTAHRPGSRARCDRRVPRGDRCTRDRRPGRPMRHGSAPTAAMLDVRGHSSREPQRWGACSRHAVGGWSGGQACVMGCVSAWSCSMRGGIGQRLRVRRRDSSHSAMLAAV